MTDSWQPPEADSKPPPWQPPDRDSDPPSNASHPAESFTPPEAEPDETPSRVAGLATRAGASGVADLAALPSMAAQGMRSMVDPVGTMIDRQQADTRPYKPDLSDFVHPERWAQAAHYFADKASDKAGLPVPSTPAERVGSAAVEAVPSMVMAPEAKAIAALSSAAGGGGSQTAKEMGAGPIASTLVGLVSGGASALSAGVAGTTRAIARGGAEGQAAMQGRLADAAASGTTLDAGQASGSHLLQYLAGMSSKLWGGAPVNKLAAEQTGHIGNRVQSIVDHLSGGNEVSPTAAGNAITQGVGNTRTPGTAFGNMRAAEKAAYQKVDDLIPADAMFDASNTMQTAHGIGTQTGVVPVPAQAKSIRQNLIAKTEANSRPTGFEAMGGDQPQPPPQLSYADLRALKTELGNSIDWGFSPADPVANGKLKALHSAVKADLTKGAMGHSPEAAAAQSTADQLYGANQQVRDSLAPIIEAKGGPEAVFKAATNGTKEGATKIGQVMSAINPDQQNIVRGTILDRIGRATPGNQNAEGNAFSANTFLTNWSKLDPAAKDALFGASGTSGSLRSSLDSLTNTISNIRSGTKLRNPSGTGEAVGHYGGAIALFEGLRETLAGHPTALVSTTAGIALNNLLARALTNPKTVAWLAKSTKAPVSALPNAVHQLSQLNDPDAQALASYLNPSDTDRPARATGGAVNEDALVDRLMKRWKEAKRATDASTKPLLRVPDEAIVHALKVSKAGL